MKRSHSVDAQPGKISPVEAAQSITPDWLTRALRTAGLDVVVSEVSATLIGTGQMSSCHRLTVRYASGEGPLSLVAKRALDSEERRLEVARINEAEVGFYRDLAPKLTLMSRSAGSLVSLVTAWSSLCFSKTLHHAHDGHGYRRHVRPADQAGGPDVSDDGAPILRCDPRTRRHFPLEMV